MFLGSYAFEGDPAELVAGLRADARAGAGGGRRAARVRRARARAAGAGLVPVARGLRRLHVRPCVRGARSPTRVCRTRASSTWARCTGRCCATRSDRVAGTCEVPPAGFEPAHPPPEGGALSPELRGLGASHRRYQPTGRRPAYAGACPGPRACSSSTTPRTSARSSRSTSSSRASRSTLAVDGQEALDLVADVAPGPDHDGRDDAAARRAGRRVAAEGRRAPPRRIPIVMVTARAQAADRQAGQDAGVDAYLTKPFDPDELVATVLRLLPPHVRPAA